MRILHYQAVTGEILEKQSRMSDHTDFGTFTMLIQDQVGGLQVNISYYLFNIILKS